MKRPPRPPRRQAPALAAFAQFLAALPLALRPLAARGHAPTIQSYTAPDTLAVVVAMQRGETLLEYAPAAPARSLLACQACGHVVLCRCGTPAQPALDEVLKVQQAMGRR